MEIYNPPLKDIRFQMEAFGYDAQVKTLPGFEEFDLETVMAFVEQGGRFLAQEMLPLNRSGDEEGLHYDPDTYDVRMPKGFKEAYQAFGAQGLIGLTHPAQYGGVGAPYTAGVLLAEMGPACNNSLTTAGGLTHALIDALVKHGTDAQKDTFLPKLINGAWSGTMCLTEPHCGSDLGLLTTKAEPEEDYYRLTGTKIWITYGEHDMTENIIHLVLARLPDAPEGIKGISLFVVPKFDLDGTRNPAYCTGLEHKMGLHASPTCVMSFEGAKGWLVGEPHKGMRAMFTMMNAARLNVGVGALGMSDAAYQVAMAFVRDRRQGRALDPAKREEGAAADNILVHPDVRRMLLNIRATNEAMRGLVLWGAMMLDVSEHHAEEAKREEAEDLLALLTPIIKSYLTERSFENISEAMQVCGGAGYTKDWDIEQLMRDERIAMIYEGTNGIQALDLVGRKLPRGQGRLFMRFNQTLTSFIRSNKDDERMAEFLTPLKRASKKLGEVTMALAGKGLQDPEEVAAVATPYLNLFAYTALSYVWCVQVQYALTQEGAFAATKLKTARYFLHNILPEIDRLTSIIEQGKQHIMDFDADEF
ncbi:MAG: acyl-CoA dehydrogenase [Myxococcota bacterium]